MTRETRERAAAAFVAYRRTREPRHLAEVFDLCAQELLLVAHHVARRGVTAEDLLQATFLEAIESADRYDETRPLQPWLCGILIHLAHREGRTTRREFEGWRVEQPLDENPVEAAHALEFVETLREAIAKLPAPQREVLTLRLIHGLTPAQIAHALNRPVGSVKSWIHRGVEHLRVVLPTGFAAALAALVTSEFALSAARERVLDLAKTSVIPETPAAGVPASAARTTAIGIGRGAMLVLAAVVVVGVWFALAWRTERGSVNQSSARVELGVDRADREHTTARAERLVDEGARRGVAKDAASKGLTLHARHSADGAPAEIVFRVEERFGVDLELRARRGRTNALGTAVLDELPPGEYRVVLDRAPALDVVVEPGGTKVEVVIDGPLAARGRVLDSGGSPIAGANIGLATAGAWNAVEVVARTDSSGAFELRGLTAEHALTAWTEGHLPHALVAVSTWGDAERALKLERTSRKLVGRVVGPRGEPMAGARVRLGEALDEWWEPVRLAHHSVVAPITLEADAEGRFECASLAERGSIAFVARATGTRAHAGSFDEEPMLEVRLDAGARWVGELPPGPETELTVEARAAAHAGELPAWSTPSARSNGGPFELGGLPEGAVSLVAHERGRVFARAERDAPNTGVVEWTPRRDRAPGGVGVVRTTSGRRIPGARVEQFGPSGKLGTLSASATGEFELDAISMDATAIGVRGPEGVFDGWIEPWIRAEELHRERDIVVRDEGEPRARLSVLILDREGEPINEGALVRAFDHVPIWSRTAGAGRLEFGPLPHGDYYLVCDGDSGLRILHGPIEVRAVDVDVGVVRERAPARLAVRFAGFDGEDASELPIALQTLDGGLGATYFLLNNGKGTTLPTVPGGHLVIVNAPTLGLVIAEVELLDGRTVEVDLDRPRGRRVQLNFQDDDPRTSIPIRVHLAGPEGKTLSTTSHLARRDEPNQGRGAAWNLSPGTWRLEARVWDRPARSIEFVVPAEGAPPVVNLDLR